MIDIEERLDELSESGLYKRMRMINGPQGPRVLLDGKPVLLLCSNNYLGLADHDRVRAAAAEAVLRFGGGAGAPRTVSGNMTLHRRLEERLAEFVGSERALLFGSGYLANIGVIPALAQPGDVIFSDRNNHASIVDGCRLSGAEIFTYDHCDIDHLEWGLEQTGERAALIVTSGVFSIDGDCAPLIEIVELADEYGVRVVVDDSHGTGAVGPEGRGAVAAADLRDEIDVITSSLSNALGSYGGFVSCDATMAKYLINCSRSFTNSTALPPSAVAAALTALEVLIEQPQRVDRLAENGRILRRGLINAGFEIMTAESPILPIVIDDSQVAVKTAELALEQNVFTQALCPPLVSDGTSRVRLTVMASHTRNELTHAAAILARAAQRAGVRPKLPSPPEWVERNRANHLHQDERQQKMSRAA